MHLARSPGASDRYIRSAWLVRERSPVRAPCRTSDSFLAPFASPPDAWGGCNSLAARFSPEGAAELCLTWPAHTSPARRGTLRHNSYYRSRQLRHDVQCLPLPSMDQPSSRKRDRALQPVPSLDCVPVHSFLAVFFCTECGVTKMGNCAIVGIIQPCAPAREIGSD